MKKGDNSKFIKIIEGIIIIAILLFILGLFTRGDFLQGYAQMGNRTFYSFGDEINP